jgi:hypothetical protein
MVDSFGATSGNTVAVLEAAAAALRGLILAPSLWSMASVKLKPRRPVSSSSKNTSSGTASLDGFFVAFFVAFFAVVFTLLVVTLLFSASSAFAHRTSMD